MLLNAEFYTQKDVVSIARQLIGKVLFTRINNEVCSGIITETEAYAGISDKASHAYGNMRSKRTEVMYREGGIAYIYLIYGMHSLFNVVTNIQEIPHAVLIRSIFPLEGLEAMQKRKKGAEITYKAGIGPGRLSKILGIDYSMSGMHLHKTENGNAIWIEDQGNFIQQDKLNVGKRIGIDYAGKDADLPYRFWIDKDGIELMK